jgi:hypothetical protein
MEPLFLSKITPQEMKSTLIGLFISLLTVLAPIKAFIIIISLFVVADTTLAIYTTIKLNGMVSFRSNKLFNVVIKTVFYMGGILLAFLLDTFIFGGVIMGISLLLAKGVTLLFSYIELKSLDETSMKLGNKSFWILLKELFAKGKELKADLGDIMKDKKE